MSQARQGLTRPTVNEFELRSRQFTAPAPDFAFVYEAAFFARTLGRGHSDMAAQCVEAVLLGSHGVQGIVLDGTAYYSGFGRTPRKSITRV